MLHEYIIVYQYKLAYNTPLQHSCHFVIKYSIYRNNTVQNQRQTYPVFRIMRVNPRFEDAFPYMFTLKKKLIFHI